MINIYQTSIGINLNITINKLKNKEYDNKSRLTDIKNKMILHFYAIIST